MAKAATIGVYGFSADSFLRTLRDTGVGLVVDVRQRRGVRGSQYAWANAARLQAALAEAGIAYRHHKELAPTTELRQLQYAEDSRQGVGKRSRQVLAADYTDRFRREILNEADLGGVIEEMPPNATTALLCVEREPAACHRSLVADDLAPLLGTPVRHLYP